MPKKAPLPHRTSIATVCVSGHLLDKLTAIAEAGFDGVEIFENDLLHYPGSRQDIYNVCQELGLRIEMYQPFRDLEGAATPEELKRSLDRLERKFQWMDELQTDLILLCSNCSPNSVSNAQSDLLPWKLMIAFKVGDKDRLVADLRAAAELAAKYNKRIAYEALAWGQHVYTWEHSWELVKEVDHPNLGICFDTFHIFSRHCNIDPIADVPAEKIFFIQLADAPILKMDHLSYSRHHRNYPLQGAFPIVPFMEKVIQAGYTGPLSLEIFNDEFRAAPAKRIAQDGLRSLLYLQSELYKGSILPPLPEVERIEYLEFAVDEARIAQLEALFLDMGLNKVAKHRSKNVSLYRQGENPSRSLTSSHSCNCSSSLGGVSFIINAEPESFASAFLLLHDTSVCALAVRVKDIQAAIDRAACLGCPVVPPAKLGEGEERVIAIQAPDDTLIYLVDSDEFWKKDFVFDVETTVSNGLTVSYSAVDHVAQALDRLSMDRFVLFYKSVFGMMPQQVIELQDPYGMTKSRAMVSPNQALRFPLNISDEKDTSIGRLVREAAGSVVHHIAFETPDIFETVASLLKGSSQNRFLRVPQNYYDDLQVRYDLSAEFITKMRNYNIMYDRDEKGEFLHLSTEQFRDRFFFEIVQRINGYEHFASINAPIRMSIHHERRNLAMKVSSALTPQSTGGNGTGEALKSLLVVFEPGCETVVDLIADILGRPTSSDGKQDGAIVGVPVAEAATVLFNVDKTQYISINMHCIENGPLDDSPESISRLCDYEFLFPKAEFVRHDLTRFLSFILGQTKPHEDLLRKPRSTFIALTFPDIRTALPNLDILTVGADALELRVDLLREGAGTGPYNPVPSLDYVAKQVMWLRQRTELPIIFTLRSQAEGGRCPNSDEKTTQYFLTKALQWGCEYIDVEIRLPEEIRNHLAENKGRSKIIASYHDLAGTLKWPSGETLRCYHAGRSYGDVVKIVGFATSLTENYELEYFRSSVNASFNHPMLAMNAGQVGQLSRILNQFFTPTTHPLLPMAAAPGQLSAAEINSAWHIMGQMPKKTIYTIGNARAIPLSMFWEKCFNELGLPHHYVSLDRISESMVQALTRQLSFGGAIIQPPLTGQPSFISSFTEEAQESGAIDTVFVRTVGNQSVIVGDNATAKALKTMLTRDFAASAYAGQPVLVVSNSFEEASSAMWALRKLNCGTIYTIGFRVDGIRGVEQCNSFESVQKLARPFVVVSALCSEQAHLINPLLKLINNHPAVKVGSTGGKVFVDLANGPRRGDPLGVAASSGWTTYGISDIAARMTVQALEVLVGQRVPFDFVRMASGRGLF
jgi:3-dehydroquinate dehydratase-1